MAEPEVGTFEDLFAELYHDPKFRKEYHRQKPYYDLILEIIRCRKRLNLTQKELAEKVGKHQSAISRIESGEHNIRLSTLIDIADALGAKVDIKFVSDFYVDDKEYRDLIRIQAGNDSSENIANTVSLEFEGV